MILAKFMDLYITLTKHYHGNQMSDIPKHSFFEERFREDQFYQIFAFLFTIFLVHDGYRAIKVFIKYQVQFCRAGHIFCPSYCFIHLDMHRKCY